VQSVAVIVPVCLETRPLVTVSALCFLQCLDTDDWVAGWTSGLQKRHSVNIQRLSFELVEEENWSGNQLIWFFWQNGLYTELVVVI